MVDDALVGGQEVEEPFIVLAIDAKDGQQPTIAPGGRRQAAFDQQSQVGPRQISPVERRVDVLPEAEPAAREAVVELIGDGPAPFAERRACARSTTN